MNRIYKILVVDDEDSIREDIKITLEMNNYIAFDAEDGVQGLKIAKLKQPDLILSDIMMPNMDGYEFLKEIQDDPYLCTIPFLFLSAKGDYAELREGMNLGADDYISKPFDIKELLESIRKRLDKYEKKNQVVQKGLDSIIKNLNRSIPHELRTPLNGILNNTDYLRKHYDTVDKEFAIEMLDMILEDSRRLQNLFDNYIFYARLETMEASGELQKYKFQPTYKPNNLIRNYCKLLPEDIKKRLKFNSVGDPETLNIEEMHFTKIFQEIFNNAIKFSYPNTEIRIESIYDLDGYKLFIRNTGRVFPVELMRMIGAYQQFDRDKFEQQGIGLGLAIVIKILKIYNGKLNIDSVEGKETKVGIFLS